MLPLRLAHHSQVLEPAGRHRSGRGHRVARVVGRQPDDGGAEPLDGAVDRAVVLRRPLLPEHREAQLESAELAPGQPHGTEQVI